MTTTTNLISPITQIRRLNASIENVYEKYVPISGMPDNNDPLATWDAMIASGKANVPGGARMAASQFLQKNTSWLSVPWQRAAYTWSIDHPGRMLVVAIKIGRKVQTWYVGKRGEYVAFIAPWWEEHKQAMWVSRNGRTRVLINLNNPD